MASEGEKTVLPERPKDGEQPPKLSKSALKKLAKEKEKAEKAAKRLEQERAAQAAAEANDTAKGLYGALPAASSPVKITRLLDLNDEHVDKEVTVQARVHNARIQSAKLAFFNFRQQTETIQGVIAESSETKVSRLMIKWAGNVNAESIVRVTGVVKRPREPVASATLSNLEIDITKMYLVSEALSVLPMQVKDAMRPPPEAEGEGEVDDTGAPIVTLNTRLNNRVLDLRTPVNQAIMRISSGVVELFSEYMRSHGSTQINTPKLLSTASEGGSEVFEVTYFERKAYLAQSPQMFKQMCIAGDMHSVFEVAPVFRAEKSNTHRHLTEFTGLDFEMEFQDHYHEVLEFAEELIVYILQGLKERYDREIKVVHSEFPKAGDFLIPEHGKALRLEYLDGIKLLKEAGVDVSEQEALSDDLTTAMEKQLGKIIHEKYQTDFYVLDHFPLQGIRPFYTMPCPEDARLSNSYDFFMRGEEIMSGAQRVHTAKLLEERLRAQDPPLDPNADGFKDYLDAFRFGCPPHAGGGLGLNRIVQFFLGLPNIRMATAFPRDPQRLRP